MQEVHAFILNPSMSLMLYYKDNLLAQIVDFLLEYNQPSISCKDKDKSKNKSRDKDMILSNTSKLLRGLQSTKDLSMDSTPEKRAL